MKTTKLDYAFDSFFEWGEDEGIDLNTFLTVAMLVCWFGCVASAFVFHWLGPATAFLAFSITFELCFFYNKFFAEKM